MTRNIFHDQPATNDDPAATRRFIRADSDVFNYPKISDILISDDRLSIPSDDPTIERKIPRLAQAIPFESPSIIDVISTPEISDAISTHVENVVETHGTDVTISHRPAVSISPSDEPVVPDAHPHITHSRHVIEALRARLIGSILRHRQRTTYELVFLMLAFSVMILICVPPLAQLAYAIHGSPPQGG